MPKLREPPKKEEEELQPVTTAGASQKLEPEVVVAKQDDDAAEELKKQLEALRKSESAARQRETEAVTQRDQALKYAQERDVALTRSQADASNSQLSAIVSGIATAQAEIEEAKNAFRMGAAQEDIDIQIAAQEKLAEAKANLVNLTNGKTALERAIKQKQEQAKAQQDAAAQQRQQPQGDQLDRTNLPQNAKEWLRAHPDYLTDQRKNAKIQSLHWDVVDEGHQPFSTSYYESLEQHLGLRAKPRQNAAEEDDAEPARTIVSAPVSRESHSSTGERNSGGGIRLTVLQREAAKMAGITEAEYAKQLGNLKTAKANGNYGGAP